MRALNGRDDNTQTDHDKAEKNSTIGDAFDRSKRR
ncbi:hypothetical protein FHX42_005274 [Saccharopolyspora lacisalsi]|uniref:Uncharacterized protein n=1 Tax=Halosaccharopolyspora lacisalsi TaxID=1000566 RepID=A0A839E846_9PSEU|nr:hypothetical protein [Halosaccharopolyspora lacisalsi]